MVMSADRAKKIVRCVVLLLVASTIAFVEQNNRRRTAMGRLLAHRSTFLMSSSEQDSKPRVYNPRANKAYSKPWSRPDTGSSSSPPVDRYSTQDAITLKNPQLLIRFRLPKEKSGFKEQLEQLQETFRQSSVDDSSTNYRRDSSWNRDPFMDSFGPTPVVTSQPDYRKGKSSKAYAEKDDGGGEFPKARSPAGRRSGGYSRENMLDEEGDDDVEGGYDADDYYGDGTNLGLSSISAGVLQSMTAEGYSLEDMQVSLYSEYGVKVSINAIKRRIQDDKWDRKGKKRTGKTKRVRSRARAAQWAPKDDLSVVLPDGPVQVQELAGLLDVGAGEVVKHLMMNMGMMVTMTQSVDRSTAESIVEAFGKVVSDESSELDEDEDETDDDIDEAGAQASSGGIAVQRPKKVLEPRPAVVTIMGHVDHGKTTLLDKIRNARVAAGEAGGITQGISAFSVSSPTTGKLITFFDTPGHAAFSEMRQRGADATDIVVLVVAADDGVMEQTRECIAAARTAKCPIVVAINKVDKEGADVARVKDELAKEGVIIEEFGGDVQCALVSAKAGTGVDDLISTINIQADVMDLTADREAPVAGTVIEARISKGEGVVVTALVQSGQLKVGDLLLAGPAWGRVRKLMSDQGKEINEAGPSTPVQIIGLNVAPSAGDPFALAENDAKAREVAEARQRLLRQAAGSVSSAAIIQQAAGFADGSFDNSLEVLKIPVVIKGDVAGSVEALRSSIEALEIADESGVCKIDVVYAGIGDVTSSDVAIAAAAKARVIAFNVAAGLNAMEDARASNIELSYYNVVYTLLDELEASVKKTLAPPPPGTLVGVGEIKQVFKLGRVGKVAGCVITSGAATAESMVRILRGKRNPVFTGKLKSLKVVKEDVKEVPTGSECGMSFDGFTDFEEGDVVECFSTTAGATG